MDIKEIRKLTGLSAQKFGDKYDIPLRTIQNWEGGVNTPPPYLVKLLERVVKEDLEPSGDLISREETLTVFADYVGGGMSMNDYEALSDIVANMPPVKQEPRTGHWKRNETIRVTYCSECGFGQYIDEYRTYNYCPNCGAKMQEVEE